MSNNLNDENINTGVSGEITFQKWLLFWHFNLRFALKHLFQIYYLRLLRRNNELKSKQFFDNPLTD